MTRYLIAFFALFLLSSSLLASTEISVELTPNYESFSPGDTLQLAAIITIPEEYKLYSNPLGPGIGVPLAITPTESDNITWLSAIQSEPHKYIPEGFEDEWTWVWEENAVIILTGIISNEATGTISSSISFAGLVCKTACVPVSTSGDFIISLNGPSDAEPFSGLEAISELSNTLPIAVVGLDLVSDQTSTLPINEVNAAEEELPIPEWDYIAQEDAVEFNLWIALFLAFVAGIILNFMPCVLPVLGIKILSFSEGRESKRSTAIAHSLGFAGGMILVFMILAYFAATAGNSWGEQFQDPRFIVGIVSLMFVFALGMFDLFIIFVPNKVAEMDMKQSSGTVKGNFAKGIFATLLATPCSGPFLGATLAWTLTQSSLVIYLVFLALGLGMASPYVILAASPKLSRLIPKPGPWMEDFKHVLGFILLGFAIYLMIGLPRDMVLPTMMLFLILTVSIMLYSRVAPFGSTTPKKLVAMTLAVLLSLGGYYFAFKVFYPSISEENLSQIESESDVVWEEFSLEALYQAEAEGRHIMIDFTANWCMNCQFNKVNVYHTPEVEALIIEKNITVLKADLTSSNPLAESLREHLGSQSIPFLAIFDSENPIEPIVMRDIVSKKNVVSVLEGLE